MDALALAAAAFAAFALLLHLASALAVAWRARGPRARTPSFENGPSVTIIRPVCGLGPHEEATLRSTFALDYRGFEVLFCCASRGDPVVPLIERLIARHPHVPARLLIGEERICENPKLNNVVKGWRAAAHGWIAIVDSNVAMPPDFLQRLLATWRDGTGLVSAPPIGCRPQGVSAELECAFLNT
jgi:ceramide glucosyltransferase